ncbi:uncharacterized protein LOC105848873 isoform X2 [Hydra vulgaris]|uniref:uncharacterized protein LOC105848873 isoform X2 n=1 Tax=Hydra vulgaris TaxID=6087 RepID=UPI0032EA7FE3
MSKIIKISYLLKFMPVVLAVDDNLFTLKSKVSSKINVLPDDFDLMFSDMVLEDEMIVALPNPCEIVVKTIESDPSFQRVTYEPTFLEMLNSVPIYS